MTQISNQPELSEENQSEDIDDLISIKSEEDPQEELPVVERDKKVQWLELIGSSLLFASAYLVLYILYDLVTALAAAHFGMEPVLYFKEIGYAEADRWYPHSVKRTFSIGAVVMGILGLTFYFLYLTLRKSYIFVRLFMLWGSLISFAVLAQRMMSVPFAKNFEYRLLDALGMELAIFASYSYYKPSTEWAIGFLGFLITIIIGILYAKPFLQTAWSSKQIGSEKERLKFLRFQVLLPVVFGALITTIVCYPVNLIPNGISFAATLVTLTVMIVHAMLMGSFKIPRQKTWERWPIVPTMVFILVIIAIKTVLTTGIQIPNPGIYEVFEYSPKDL